MENPIETDVWLTVEEACLVTGVSSNSIYSVCSQEKVESKKEGRKRLVNAASLFDYVNSEPHVQGVRMMKFDLGKYLEVVDESNKVPA